MPPKGTALTVTPTHQTSSSVPHTPETSTPALQTGTGEAKQTLENDKILTTQDFENRAIFLDDTLVIDDYFPAPKPTDPEDPDWDLISDYDLIGQKGNSYFPEILQGILPKFTRIPFYSGFQEKTWSEIINKLATELTADATKHIKNASPSDLKNIFTWPTTDAEKKHREKINIYINENKELITLISKPTHPTVTKNHHVIEKIASHAQNTFRNISKEELSTWVVVGENIAKAINAHSKKSDDLHKSVPVSFSSGNSNFVIESNAYTVRALCWYMMASAAAQDLERGALDPSSQVSDMVTSGIIIMKDPNNAIFNFLSRSKDAAPRTSSHLQDRTNSKEDHYFFSLIPSRQKIQWGIEDYEGLLPGHGGALLFDQLKTSTNDKTPELFVKFEAVGCPHWIDEETYNNQFYSLYLGHALAAGISLNAQHALEFVSTRLQSHSQPNEVVRQEHLYKGVLKPTYTKINAFFDKIYSEGIPKAKNGEQEVVISKAMQSYGLPAVWLELDRIEQLAKESGKTALETSIRDLRAEVKDELKQYGLVSDRHGIERRGAEVHLSLEAEEVGARLVKQMPLPASQANDRSAQ